MNTAPKSHVRPMKYFNDLCDVKEIMYYSIAGTLLGTVRHSGQIPWDDDIDVAIDILYYKGHPLSVTMHSHKWHTNMRSISSEYFFPTIYSLETHKAIPNT